MDVYDSIEGVGDIPLKNNHAIHIFFHTHLRVVTHAQIFITIALVVHWYLMSLSFKYYIDPSFRCGDIPKKMISTFFDYQFSMY